MTTGEAHSLLTSLRRQLLLADVTRILLIAAVGTGCLGMFFLSDSSLQTGMLWSGALGASILWMLLTVLSIRALRRANHASVYIASGRLDLAEEQLKNAIQSFSLYGSGQLVACHNLAVIEHGQKNYRVAAELCNGVLSLRRSHIRNLAKTCRMLLADCRLYLGDTLAALRAIEPLRLDDPAMSLADKLILLPIELRCQVAKGDFQAATQDLSWKVRRAELLDSPRAALVHALLAKASAALGKASEAQFLEQRARLYFDLDELAKHFDLLRDSPLTALHADNK